MAHKALAYPLPPGSMVDGAASIHPDFAGMEIRDVFAGQAMAAILSVPDSSLSRIPDIHMVEAIADVARLSYRIADAMMRERER